MASQDPTAVQSSQEPELLDQVQEQAGELVGQARQQLMTQVTTQKDRAASGLETAAGLLRGAGEQLRALDQPTAAQYVDGAAHRTQEFSEQLRTQDVGQLVEATERFARRQPALFAGGALALGYFVSRFFLSSGRQQEQRDSDERRRAEMAYPPYPATAAGPGYGADLYASGGTGTVPGGTLGYGAGSAIDAMPTLDEPVAGGYLDDPLLDGSLGGTPSGTGSTSDPENR